MASLRGPHGTDQDGSNAVSAVEVEDEEVVFGPDEMDDQPSTSSLSTPIAAMIDPAIKQKIWQDKYIDLAQLLPQNCTPNSTKKGFQLHVSGNSALSVVPNKSKFATLTIDQWTTEFLRFMAIYGERFPESIPHLIKHGETVRNLAATPLARSGWLMYDQQVRMDRQVRGWPGIVSTWNFTLWQPDHNPAFIMLLIIPFVWRAILSQLW